MRKRIKEYANRKIKKDKWVADGVCRECGDDNTVKSNFCEKCYLIRVSAKRLGSGKYWKEIKNLLIKQNFKCPITGDNLTFDNMELDHITPSSKNGKQELSNVRWITMQANRAKWNFTDKELFDFCNKVINHLKKG